MALDALFADGNIARDAADTREITSFGDARLNQGKQAGIIMIRRNDLNLSGAFDPYNAVVGFAHPGNIDTVMIAGTILKRHGQMLRGDIPALQQELAKSGQRIFRELKAKAATADFA